MSTMETEIDYAKELPVNKASSVKRFQNGFRKFKDLFAKKYVVKTTVIVNGEVAFNASANVKAYNKEGAEAGHRDFILSNMSFKHETIVAK